MGEFILLSEGIHAKRIPRDSGFSASDAEETGAISSATTVTSGASKFGEMLVVQAN